LLVLVVLALQPTLTEPAVSRVFPHLAVNSFLSVAAAGSVAGSVA